MKVVFLDIDGVLNSEDWFSSEQCIERENKGGFPDSHLDASAINRVNAICKKTGANIVLSTSWRYMEGVEEILYRNGLSAEIIGKTPDLSHKRGSGVWVSVVRGEEIQAWIDQNMPQSYVILDDDSDMLTEQKDRFINTDPIHGLTNKDANDAINLLLYDK